MADTRYIIGDKSGWLRVKLEPKGKIVALAEYLRVEFIETKPDKRDYFKIVEGVEKGKIASVKKTGNRSNLGEPLSAYKGRATLVFDITKSELTYGGNKKANAITHHIRPIPTGTHNIQMPDFPHDLGRTYIGKSPYALSWFYLGNGNAVPGSSDRYLHTGRVSRGCVTVQPDAWTNLYKYLILSRKGDGKNVGTIKVIERP